MKFGIAKLPNTLYKNTEKSLNSTKKQQQKIKLIQGQNSKSKFLLRWKKKFCHSANSVPLLLGGQEGLCVPSWFTKNTFFGASRKVKKTGNEAQRDNNIQFYLLD